MMTKINIKKSWIYDFLSFIEYYFLEYYEYELHQLFHFFCFYYEHIKRILFEFINDKALAANSSALIEMGFFVITSLTFNC